MARVSKITGVKEVLGRLRRVMKRNEAGTERGLKRAGLMIQRESQLIVPIDTDVLRLSARTRNKGGRGFKADIVVSYRTDYAVYVHENQNAAHASGKSAKYLEKPARTKRKLALRIIREEAKVRRV